MPVPDFSPGEVLTAAAMDSIGLWKVTSGTLSSTATNIVGCFSSDYRNYRIVIDQISLSSAGEIYWQLLDNTTPNASNHRWALLGLNALGTGLNSATNTTVAEAFTGINHSAGVDNLILSALTMDIMGPFIAQRTFAHTSAICFTPTNAFRYGLSMNNSSVSYNGIRFLTQSAVTMTGNYTVYGYRN
jgi:hypothetical protein